MSIFFHYFFNLIFVFLEGGKGREKEREKHQCERETDQLPLARALTPMGN